MYAEPMLKISPDSYPRRDFDGLCAFLSAARERAISRNRPQLVSISLEVRHTDPLAVLHSIHIPGERHCYLERAADGIAVAGAEAVLSIEVGGEDRFLNASSTCRLWLEDTIAFGDLDLPFAGPHFFCGFTFKPHCDDATPFGGGYLFVPRWQVARCGADCVATANLVVDANTPIEEAARRVVAAHEKLSDGHYEETELPAPRNLSLLGDNREWYESAVASVLARIAAGECEKVVLARTLELAAGNEFSPLATLHQLRSAYPGCWCYSFAGEDGVSLVGASPERLVEADDTHFRTEAIAGSIRRGAGAAEDARLAWALLGSDKDLREHGLVVQSIVDGLTSLGLTVEPVPKPRILALGNVQHLHTPVVANRVGEVDLLQVAAELHPTPAVGGSPRDQALSIIDELEEVDRGLYAGVLGWFDWRGRGQLVVPLRAAEIAGKRARLYAGAGIVKGSEPRAEREETDLKFRAMLSTIGDKIAD